MKKQHLKLFWGEMQQLKKPKWLLNNSLGTQHRGGTPLKTFQKKRQQFIEAFTALRAAGQQRAWHLQAGVCSHAGSGWAHY